MASGRETTSWDNEGVGRGNFFKKTTENLNFWHQLANFFQFGNLFQKIPEIVEKLQFFGVREGVK